MPKKHSTQSERLEDSADELVLANSGTMNTEFQSFDDQAKELNDLLTQKLEEKKKAGSYHPNAPNRVEGSPPNGAGPLQDPDQQTKEFVQLADFIAKERIKQESNKGIVNSDVSGKLLKYQEAIDQELGVLKGQKGLQINKAA